MKKTLAQRKRILITAVFLFVFGLSAIPAQQTSALSLRDITNLLFTQPDRTPVVEQPQQRPPQPQQTSPVQPQQTTPAVTPPAQPVPVTTSPAAPTQQTQNIAPATVETLIPAPVEIVDTSSEVLATASQQTTTSVGQIAPVYTTRQLDPIVAQYLLYSGLAVAAVGAGLYTLTFIRKGEKTYKTAQVKISS